MAHYDDLNTKQIWTVGLVSAVLTGVTILAVQVLYFALLNSFEASKLADTEYTSSIAHMREQEEHLNTYGVDAESNRFHMPVERAMELMAERVSETLSESTEEGESA